MKQPLRSWAVAAVAAAAAMAFNSCAYDPAYAYGGTYSSGYGDGYGYGGDNFSTSVFVSTGDPRWGYDPNCYSYYDYSRRCYYDPYLNGYYPIGYRPPIIIGAPHPYGWRPGHGYCPPPRSVHNVTVVNYRNRESAYRSSHYDWAHQVRQQSTSHGHGQDKHSNSTPYSKKSYSPQGSSSNKLPGSSYISQQTKPSSHGKTYNPYSSSYNKHTTTDSSRENFSSQHHGTPQAKPYKLPPPAGGRSFQPGKPTSPPQYERSSGHGNSDHKKESNPAKESKEEKHGFRGLGQG